MSVSGGTTRELFGSDKDLKKEISDSCFKRALALACINQLQRQTKWQL
jgi:hypothetical protein